MSRVTTREELAKLRSARDELLRLSEFLHLPNYTGLEFVERALPLANSHATDEEKTNAYFLTQYGVLLDQATTLNQVAPEFPTIEDAIGTIDTGSDLEGRILSFWSQLEGVRIEFRRALQLLLNSQKRAERELYDYVCESLDDLVLVPTLTWGGSKAQIQIKYCPLSTRAVLGYTLMLLLDCERNLGRYLRKCKLDSCDGFFISRASTKGGRKPLYCRTDHKKEADSASGAKRTREYRKRLKKRQRTKRSTK